MAEEDFYLHRQPLLRLAALCMLLFYHPMAFLAGRALGGVAASSWVTFTVLYSSYFNPDESTKSITMINMANQIGRMLSFVFAGLFVAHFGPRSAFLVSAIGGFLALALSIGVHEEAKIPGKKPVRVRDLLAVAGEPQSAGDKHPRGVCADRGLFHLLLVHVKPRRRHWSHAGPAQLHEHYSDRAGHCGQLCGQQVILKWIDAKWLVFTGFLVTALYCVLLPFTHTIPQLYGMQSIAGIGNTLTLSVLMGLCVRDIGTDRRAAAMGFFQAVYGLGMTVGPVIMGFIADR
jgi:MFS family permease